MELTTFSASLVLALVLAYGIKVWSEYKLSGKVSLQWAQVLDFCLVAVNSVAQTHKVKPDGMSDEAWDLERRNSAVQIVQTYAFNLGLKVSEENTRVILAAIEAAVKKLKR